MDSNTWLQQSQKKLTAAGIVSARLDCLILLEDVLGIDRAAILAHPETEITAPQIDTLNKKITQRAKHVPLAYIRGRVSFFGRDFAINQHVLVPRPETETMIEMLKKITSHESRVTILDIGTGSGAIAVTAKLELPKADVVATDIDPACLKIARQNAKQLHADITFLQGDLLEPLRNPNLVTSDSIIMANLPYVPERYSINQAAEHEPKHAIFGGKDGLNLYRKLWEQIATLPQKPDYIFAESLLSQHENLELLARTAGYVLHQAEGLIQVFKSAKRN